MRAGRSRRATGSMRAARAWVPSFSEGRDGRAAVHGSAGRRCPCVLWWRARGTSFGRRAHDRPRAPLAGARLRQRRAGRRARRRRLPAVGVPAPLLLRRHRAARRPLPRRGPPDAVPRGSDRVPGPARARPVAPVVRPRWALERARPLHRELPLPRALPRRRARRALPHARGDAVVARRDPGPRLLRRAELGSPPDRPPRPRRARALLVAIPPRTRLASFLGALAAVLLAVNLPFALLRFDNWSWFFRFNAGRGAENSIWDALHVKGPLLEIVSAGPLLLSAVLGALATLAAARRGGDGPRAARLATALGLVVWIATNKIWSPQYALYGFFAGALAAAPLGLFLVLSAVSALDFHLAFEVRARGWEPAFRDGVWHPVNVARTVLWLVLAAWTARALWRAARAPAPPRAA